MLLGLLCFLMRLHVLPQRHCGFLALPCMMLMTLWRDMLMLLLCGWLLAKREPAMT